MSKVSSRTRLRGSRSAQRPFTLLARSHHHRLQSPRPKRSGRPAGNTHDGRLPDNVASGAANNYGDPWLQTPSAPEWEGVSLILVMPGDSTTNGTVAFYDTGIAGITCGGTFGDSLGYTLVLPTTTAQNPWYWHNIGADGQVGVSLAAAFPQIAAEQMFISNTQIGGFPRTPGTAPETLDPDSDWSETIAGPLPQL